MKVKNLFWTVLGLLLWCSAPAQPIVPFPYEVRKEITVDSAVVVTAHPLATKVGIEILRRGGNAADAAVAVQFALAVVYPQAGNIGGGGFLLYRNAAGENSALDYRETAPAKATRDMYLDSAGRVQDALSRYGRLASGVPGTVDGMWETHKRYGKMPWAELIYPAILLADKGFQITQQEADNLNAERVRFIKNSSVVPAFVSMEPWTPGKWLIQKDLANTLRRIAEQGRNGFYEGGTAALIVHEMERKGGILSAEDLKNYRSVWRTPLEFDYKDLHVISMPPPSSGGILLQQMLGMLKAYPIGSYGFHSASSVHLMAEVERRAFADRSEHMADPDFWKVPQKQLVRDTYLLSRMADYNAEKASPSKTIKPGTVKESEETTHYNIIDAQGNTVSVTTTLNDSYGSRTVVAGAGFIMNNEMDDFSAKPGSANLYGAVGGSANAIVPGKRPLSSMTPTIVTKEGKVWLVVGTPGGTTIPTSVFQIIVNLREFNMSLPDAVQTKRFHHQWLPDMIQCEEGAFDEPLLEKLRAMGHVVEMRGRIGRVEAILRLPNGKWQGVADDHGDHNAGGY